MDSLVAWGRPAAVAVRVRAYLDAGADHVAVHPLSDGSGGPEVDQLGALAAELPLAGQG